MATKSYKVQLELVNPAEHKELIQMQAKINTWLTTKLIRKFDIIPLPTGMVIFRILLHNNKPE